jgi:hypothetical protein
MYSLGALWVLTLSSRGFPSLLIRGYPGFTTQDGSKGPLPW